MISETTAKPEGSKPKTSRAATPKTLRPLSAAQAKQPMKHAFYGGFRNIAFQVGVVHHLPGDPPNQFYLRTNKTAKNPLPLLLPDGVPLPRHGTMVKVTCSVVGSVDRAGNPYPQLMARFLETPNVFEASTRRTTELLNTPADPTEALKKQTGNNNEVMLTGVVVGRRMPARRTRADGTMEENPAVTFLLRQDADPEHVIPVICDKKLAENASRTIRFGDIISIKGQFHTSTIAVYKLDENGQPAKDEAGALVPETNADGSVKTRFHPFIYLTSYPGVALDEHILFSDPQKMAVPEWIVDQINKEIEMKAALGRQQNKDDAAPERPSLAPAAVTAAEYVSSAPKTDLGEHL